MTINERVLRVDTELNIWLPNNSPFGGMQMYIKPPNTRHSGDGLLVLCREDVPISETLPFMHIVV